MFPRPTTYLTRWRCLEILDGLKWRGEERKVESSGGGVEEW
jgi:hypothetical protein